MNSEGTPEQALRTRADCRIRDKVPKACEAFNFFVEHGLDNARIGVLAVEHLECKLLPRFFVINPVQRSVSTAADTLQNPVATLIVSTRFRCYVARRHRTLAFEQNDVSTEAVGAPLG